MQDNRDKEQDILRKLGLLERQLEILESKLEDYKKKIDSLKIENKKIKNNLDLLEEENKKLQTFYKEALQFHSKVEIARQKLKKLIEKLNTVI
ncbi:MAG: hypothetical protein NZ928_03480 [Endomicrobia bacterium]|nr:hypothetical protein [Endomicrobiia bacterium]MDW8056021.1 hypothetical protein [Elusimicrobiota bacterium]